jgi:hypothetical protein
MLCTKKLEHISIAQRTKDIYFLNTYLVLYLVTFKLFIIVHMQVPVIVLLAFVIHSLFIFLYVL